MQTDNEDDVNDIQDSVKILFETMKEEATLGNAIMDSLVHKYNRKAENIGNNLQKLVDITKAELDDQFKDVTSYPDFKEKFKSRILSCGNAIHNWLGQVQRILPQPLEKSD
jgi:hypothetical protein